MIWLLIYLIRSQEDNRPKAVSRGSTNVFVDCEQCQVEYVYRLRCTASGYSYRDADRRLQKKLDTGVDAVPCPSCGWYQQHMVEMVRGERVGRLWMVVLGSLLVAGLVLGGAAMFNAASGNRGIPALDWIIFWIISAAVLVPGVGLVIYLFTRHAYRDPNDEDQDARLNLASRRAKTAQDFEAGADY